MGGGDRVNRSSRLFHAIVLMGCALGPGAGCGTEHVDPCAGDEDGGASPPQCAPVVHEHPDGDVPDGGWPPTK
jgi:hypothetical protein